MKVYEKIGLPYLTAEQFIDIRTGCPKNSHREYKCSNDTCTECYYNYLNSNVSTKKVKRWEIYNGDFVKAQTEFSDLCKEEYAEHGCGSCSHNSDRNCFGSWLMEEIEVEVE